MLKRTKKGSWKSYYDESYLYKLEEGKGNLPEELRYLTLPLPPTDNRCRAPMCRRGQASMYKTPEYREWTSIAAGIWNSYLDALNDYTEIPEPLWEPEYHRQMDFTYVLSKNNNRADSQNFEKAIRDFFSTRVYSDDKHVKVDLERPCIVTPGKSPTVVIDVLRPYVHKFVKKLLPLE